MMVRLKANVTLYAVIALGLLSFGLLIYGDFLWRNNFRRTVPVLDNLMHAKDSLAEGYLWMEEFLRGNEAIGTETISSFYDQATLAVDACLQGRSGINGLYGLPPRRQELIAEFKKFKNLIRQTKNIAETRCLTAESSDTRRTVDLQLATALHALGLMGRAINSQLQESVSTTMNTQRDVFTLTLTLWLIILSGTSGTVYVSGKRRRLAEEQLRRAHAGLEHQVQERTAELVVANAHLKREVEERETAEAALSKSEKELRLLSSQLLTIQENERGRIALELHDRIGQTLTAIKFRMEHTLGQARLTEGSAAADLCAPLIPMIQDAIDEIRRIYMGLRPTTLDDLGILATIGWFCREFENIYHSIQIEKEISVEEREVPDSLKIVIFRILQEALNNIAKHSKADGVTVGLRKKDSFLDLIVRDNGIGFDVATALSVEASKRGFGLGSMKERTELSGGSFSIESAGGAGTTVRAAWPIAEA